MTTKESSDRSWGWEPQWLKSYDPGPAAGLQSNWHQRWDSLCGAGVSSILMLPAHSLSWPLQREKSTGFRTPLWWNIAAHLRYTHAEENHAFLETHQFQTVKSPSIPAGPQRRNLGSACEVCSSTWPSSMYLPIGPREACDLGIPTGREDKASRRPGRKKGSPSGQISSTISALPHTGCRSPLTPVSKAHPWEAKPQPHSVPKKWNPVSH